VTVSAFQQLGIVDELIAREHTGFAYPEAAQVSPVLSDGTTERNYVLQGGALSIRQARRSWVMVPTADMHTIRGYASTKDQVLLVEEDGTERAVIVMDFVPRQMYVGHWEVTVLLLEAADPDTPGS
jgi:hypothetical protein